MLDTSYFGYNKVRKTARIRNPSCLRLQPNFRRGTEYVVRQKVSEYAEEMPQSHNADQPKPPWGSRTELQQPHNTKKTIKVKQPDIYYGKPFPIDLTKGKVSKGAKIRNRYNQVPYLTQDTNGKVTNAQ